MILLGTLFILALLLLAPGTARAVELGPPNGLILTLTESGADPVSGTDYSFANPVLTILSDTAMTVSTNGQTGNYIRIAQDIEANLTLNGVDIASPGNLQPAINIQGNATLNLTLAAGTTNALQGGANAPGIMVRIGNTLNIRGTGELTATGGNNGGAGIGGNIGGHCGTVNIYEGDITANGTGGGAGIGGGSDGNGGTVNIYGGTVKATGDGGGAGIGGGRNRDGGNVTIMDGNVTATGGVGFTSGGGGAGIGGGGGVGTFHGGGAGTITIHERARANVNATGGAGGVAGGGGGPSGKGANIGAGGDGNSAGSADGAEVEPTILRDPPVASGPVLPQQIAPVAVGIEPRTATYSGSETISVDIDGEVRFFSRLTCNGTLVSPGNYTIEVAAFRVALLSEGAKLPAATLKGLQIGNARVTLHSAWLDTLNPGTYELKFYFVDKVATATLNVRQRIDVAVETPDEEIDVPATGDHSGMVLLVFVMAAMAAVAALRKIRE